jgi:hypothetical protein
MARTWRIMRLRDIRWTARRYGAKRFTYSQEVVSQNSGGDQEMESQESGEMRGKEPEGGQHEVGKQGGGSQKMDSQE